MKKSKIKKIVSEIIDAADDILSFISLFGAIGIVIIYAICSIISLIGGGIS